MKIIIIFVVVISIIINIAIINMVNNRPRRHDHCQCNIKFDYSKHYPNDDCESDSINNNSNQNNRD